MFGQPPRGKRHNPWHGETRTRCLAWRPPMIDHCDLFPRDHDIDRPPTPVRSARQTARGIGGGHGQNIVQAERRRIDRPLVQITAVVAGYEVMGKFGQFSWAFDPPRRPTQLFGPFGSITTAAKLLGLDHEQTIVALAYAAHTAMGLAENDLGPVSHWYSLICRNAIIGAYSSRAGAWGSPTVIEGRYGFADAFLGGREIDVDAVVDQLGDDYMVMNSCEKRYPGTTLNQIPIELMRKLVIDDGIRADDVARVRITFPEERRQFSAGHELGPIANSGLAASSFAFQCAMLLLDGKQDPARYEDFRDPAILDVLDRMAVDFVPDKPVRYTRIELETTSGERFVKEGDDFQFSPDQTRLVLERDGAGVLPDNNIERAIELLDDFENVADVRELTTVLAA